VLVAPGGHLVDIFAELVDFAIIVVAVVVVISVAFFFPDETLRYSFWMRKVQM